MLIQTFFQAHMPDTFCSAMYLAPSLPVIVLPQHLLAGYGGLGRERYFLVVCMTHLVCLIRLCTRFQYLRNPVYVFFVLEEGIRFRVAMFLRYAMPIDYIYCIVNFHFIHNLHSLSAGFGHACGNVCIQSVSCNVLQVAHGPCIR